ncbi:uncharacterized protein LY89DRAFT_588059 [Mollisia scopiformis]|uniref:Uncharacterized protein n=1 Tax=Mollisia scopiformis TaxID=149040 RepID=A0A194X5Q0_MOLSC|nr:uncharacterized protein LY89DRAFT_588059 [Mollisia scopiformis]KUJ15510.1 hypothetical protein LY89DRAFT_588059 [Mollisia scopiformis]
MLLTLKQPANHGYKVYSPPTPPSSSRFLVASPSTGHSLATVPTNNKSLPPLPSKSMSGPHRGLPPLNLPSAQTQQQHPPAPPAPIGQPPLGQLPAPPQQWQGAEESMRNWLHAKAEEDKRKQEEEKTRQESLRLEQRKIEQDMLRQSLNGGIPPYMIPMVFAGMGGGNLPNASLEWAQHYMAQAHHLQQQQQLQQQQLLPSQGQTSPEQVQRRDSRAVGPPYGTQQHPVPITLPSTPIGPGGSQQGSNFPPSYLMSPASRSRQGPQAQSSIARPPQTSHLPRLNTGEIHIQPPPAGPSMQILPGQPASHPLQQSQSVQQQESQSSPSIYFHHWQPPTTQAGTSNHTSSPKKRKATGPQQPAPPPTSQPQYTSPPFSRTGSSVSNTPSSRRRGHSRQRSDMSSRGLDSYGRPSSRQGGFTSRGLASPSQAQSGEPTQVSTMSAEAPRRRSGGSHPVSSLLEQSESRPQSQAHPQSQASQQQTQGDPQYSAGPEMRHEARRSSVEGESSRGGNVIKRDEGRD